MKQSTKKVLKVVAGILLVALISVTVYFYLGFFGNPVITAKDCTGTTYAVFIVSVSNA